MPIAAFKQRQKLESYFAPYPEALENNKKLPQLLEYDWFFRGNIMPGHNGLTEKDCEEILRKKCKEAIPKRYKTEARRKEAMERLEYELEIIAHKNFCSYFLNVEEMAALFEYTCGRGSSAASLVNYLLHIMHGTPSRRTFFLIAL